MVKISRKIESKAEDSKIREAVDLVKLAVERHFFDGGKIEDGFVVHVAKDYGDGVLNVTVS